MVKLGMVFLALISLYCTDQVWSKLLGTSSLPKELGVVVIIFIVQMGIVWLISKVLPAVTISKSDYILLAMLYLVPVILIQLIGWIISHDLHLPNSVG